MSKKSRFSRPFEKQYGRPSQALLKSASQHIYLIHWVLGSQLSWKNFLLLTWKILRLVVNTLAVDKKYLVLNRDNLTIPIQMQLSEKQKTFSQFFSAFLKSSLNFKHFEKRWPSQFLYFGNYRLQKKWLAKCQKVSFQRTLWQAIWQTFPSTVEICITASLSYSLSTEESIELEKLSLIDMKNLEIGC